MDDTPAIHEDFQKILAPAHASSTEMNELEIALLGEDDQPKEAAAQFELVHANQGQDALERVKESQISDTPFKLAFVDMRMPPGWDGIETIKHLWAADPRIQIVICTAYSDYSWNELTDALGTSDSLIILKKPFDNIEVVQLAHALSSKWDLTRASEEHVADLGQTVNQRTRQLNAAEDRFMEAFNASPLAQVIQTLPEGRIVEVNEAYEDMVGISRVQAIGLDPDNFIYEVDREMWKATLRKLSAGEEISAQKFSHQSPGKPEMQVLYHARRIHIDDQPHCLWVFQDISDVTELEEQFRHAQKMEAIGQLAAGVAHDFNNVLTAIQGFTTMSLDRDDIADDLREDLEQVVAAGKRATLLTRQLLLFSRKQVTHETSVDVQEMLKNLEPLVRRLLGSSIDFRCACGDDCPSVRADIANLEQLILNLVSNARDALGDKGTITIQVVSRTIPENVVKKHSESKSSRFVEIKIIDDGPGIPPEILPRIFDPFFTTKPVGKGTGLGLATCYGIAKQHQGWLDVETSREHGTAFSVILPAEATPEGDRLPDLPFSGIPREASKLRGKGKVLVVEDDPVAAQLLAAVLRRHGYQATCTENAPVALKTWHEQGEFDLVFSDMVMPCGMNGAELAAKLLELKPGLPIVLTTGYSEVLLHDKVPQEILDQCELIMKPYDVKKLLFKLQKLLDPDRSARA